MYFYAPIARVISIEIMLSILIFNKMINFQFDLKKNNLKTRTKLKHKHSKD